MALLGQRIQMTLDRLQGCFRQAPASLDDFIQNRLAGRAFVGLPCEVGQVLIGQSLEGQGACGMFSHHGGPTWYGYRVLGSVHNIQFLSPSIIFHFLFKIKRDIFIIMDDKISPTLTTADLHQFQQDHLISRVLDLLFQGIDDEGRAYCIETATRKVGVSSATWYRWASEGALDAHKAALAAKMSNVIQEVVIPHYREIYESLVEVALGRRPKGADEGMTIKVADMLKAIKLLAAVIPVKPLAEQQNDEQAALDYLEGGQFTQIHVHGDMSFVYQGNGQPQFGKLAGEIIEGEKGE